MPRRSSPRKTTEEKPPEPQAPADPFTLEPIAADALAEAEAALKAGISLTATPIPYVPYRGSGAKHGVAIMLEGQGQTRLLWWASLHTKPVALLAQLLVMNEELSRHSNEREWCASKGLVFGDTYQTWEARWQYAAAVRQASWLREILAAVGFVSQLANAVKSPTSSKKSSDSAAPAASPARTTSVPPVVKTTPKATATSTPKAAKPIATPAPAAPTTSAPAPANPLPPNLGLF